VPIKPIIQSRTPLFLVTEPRTLDIIVGVFVPCNFQIGNNKIKLLMEYESVTKKFLLSIESILQSDNVNMGAFHGT
jgi:hypothetical protein